MSKFSQCSHWVRDCGVNVHFHPLILSHSLSFNSHSFSSFLSHSFHSHSFIHFHPLILIHAPYKWTSDVHTHTYTHAHAHTCIHTHIYTHIYIHTHIYIYTYTHIYTHTFTHTNTHTHKLIHTQTHTHTHSHVQASTVGHNQKARLQRQLVKATVVQGLLCAALQAMSTHPHRSLRSHTHQTCTPSYHHPQHHPRRLQF